MPRTCSPLRYPGGKSKLYPLIRPIVLENIENGIYIEPFAGGAGLGLQLLFNGDIQSLVLNDIDYHIYAFWHACLHFTDQFCEMIERCQLNMDSWNEQKNVYATANCHKVLDVGFATFFLNRCNVSGVIRGGPIGGKEQKGKYLMDARFNRAGLIEKIQRIGRYNEQIEFFNLDASNFLLERVSRYPTERSFLNIDPPYVKKGPLLYENSFLENDHVELANVIQTLRQKWIVTYDECDLIYRIFECYRKNVITLNYSAGRTKSGQELIIYGDMVKIPN